MVEQVVMGVSKEVDADAPAGGLREQTIGVVDIGSNTVHLLAARTNGRSVFPLLDLSKSLRLGDDVDMEGSIGEWKLRELVRTVREYQVAAAEVGVDRLHLLATQAVRIAANSQEVCDTVVWETGLPVEILAPDIEASIAFMGVDAECPSVGPQMMVDIGGGSMQIAVGQYGQVWDSVSLPLGGARVATHFLPSDPPTDLEEAGLINYLAQVVPPALPLPDTNITGGIGVGGTLRRISALLGMKPRQNIDSDAIEGIIAVLRGRTVAEIASRYGLKPEQAKLLLPVMLLVREVLKGYNFPPFVVAAYGIREGAILYLARGKG